VHDPCFEVAAKSVVSLGGRPLDLHVVVDVLVVHSRGHLRGRSRHQVGAGGLRLGGRRVCTGRVDK